MLDTMEDLLQQVAKLPLYSNTGKFTLSLCCKNDTTYCLQTTYKTLNVQVTNNTSIHAHLFEDVNTVVQYFSDLIKDVDICCMYVKVRRLDETIINNFKNYAQDHGYGFSLG